MPKEPRISVLLPTYNGAQFLKEAIESVLSQTLQDFELLISDDCSQDETALIAQEFAAKDERIQLLPNPKNLGLFQNYNRCIEASRAPYIKPFAQDDVLAANALATMADVLDSEPEVALVSSAREYVDACGASVQTVRRYEKKTKLSAEDAIADNLFSYSNWIGEPCTVMFRRQHAGTGFCTDYWHYGDIEYWLRLLEHGAYVFVPEILVRFRTHKTSGTHRNYQGLAVVSDVWRLGRAYEEFAIKKGIGRQSFYESLIENAASQIHHSVDSLGIQQEQLWNSDIETLTRDDLRQLLTRSLLGLAKYQRQATSSQAAANEMQGRMSDLHGQIEMLTRRVNELDQDKQRLQSELARANGSVMSRITNKLGQALSGNSKVQ